MALKLIIPPAEAPVTLAEAKAQCRVDTADEDVLIARLIEVATALFDGPTGRLRRALKPQTYEMTYDNFPCGPLAIPVRPLIDVVSIKYDDEYGAEQTVDLGDYYVDAVSDPAWIIPISGFSWPSTLSAVNTVRVRFRAGYEDVSGDVTTVPERIRHAILLTVADMYKQRETVAAESMSQVPMSASVERLVHDYMVFT